MLKRTRKWIGVVTMLVMSGCACWQAEHAQEPKCVIAHQIVDCTTAAVGSFLPALVAVFKSLIGTGQLDWGQVAEIAKSMGFRDGGCLLANLENDFSQKAAAAPGMMPLAKVARTTLDAHRTIFRAGNVRFKVVDAEGKEVLR